MSPLSRIILVGLLALAPTALAQESAAKGKGERVETSVRLLTEMNIVPLTVDVEPLSKWLKPILEGVQSRFRDEKEARDVIIQVVLKKKGDHEVIISGRPAPSEAEVKDLKALVDLAGAPRPKLVDLAFRIETKLNGGDPDPKREFSPKLLDPFQSLLDRFARAGTAGQVAMLRAWARDEAIPILAATATSADPKFEGVVNFGKALAKLDLGKPIDVEALTERNPDFWRATLEMARGNMLTLTARVALHSANGEFDKARRISEIAASFDANRSGPSRILGEFRALHGLLAKGIEARVNGGIALHDKGQYDRAIAVYKGVLADNPRSAWPLYETFHSQRTILMEGKQPVEEVQADWPEARKAILAADPLYATMAEARGKDEAHDVFRRMKINELFKDRSKARADLLEYADIARDLDQYGYAAPIYWYALSGFAEKDRGGRDLIEDFLYCLDRLGVKEIKANFKGDHAAAFARIDALRKKEKDEGPASKFVDDEKPWPKDDDRAPKTPKP